jgi:hypothetical protein
MLPASLPPGYSSKISVWHLPPTYQAGKLFFIGLQPSGKLSVFERTFERCMGLYAQDGSLYMSSLYQLWRFENTLQPGQIHDNNSTFLTWMAGTAL